MALKQGELLIGRYRIEEGLGQGSLYRAHDGLRDRLCRLQEVSLSPQDQLAEEFRGRARALAALDDPDLPQVSDCFCLGDCGYLVTAWSEGRSLAALGEEDGRPCSERQVREWLAPLLDALERCQARGVRHGAIQPSNLILRPGGQVSLGAFQVGRAGPPSPYSAPELGSGRADERADIYALGATIYALLSGREPTPAADRARGAVLPTLREQVPGLSSALDAAVMRALELDPAERPQSVAALRRALNGEAAQAGGAAAAALPAILQALRWPILLEDDFDGVGLDWDTGESDDELSIGSQEITGGKYRWQAKALSAFSWFSTAEVQPLADFYLSVLVAQPSGPADSEHGLIFRADGDDHYTFSIRADGRFAAYLEHRDEQKVLLGWAATPAILPGQANRLSVLAGGSHFVLLVNDRYVGEFDDGTLAEGTVGMLIGMEKAGETTVFEFDRFELRAP